jgi:hypothetical protein
MMLRHAREHSHGDVDAPRLETGWSEGSLSSTIIPSTRAARFSTGIEGGHDLELVHVGYRSCPPRESREEWSPQIDQLSSVPALRLRAVAIATPAFLRSSLLSFFLLSSCARVASPPS